jgi:hypothetical protein
MQQTEEKEKKIDKECCAEFKRFKQMLHTKGLQYTIEELMKTYMQQDDVSYDDMLHDFDNLLEKK